MAITVKKVTFWRSEIDNRPGALAGILGPLSSSKADLQAVMGYRYPGNPGRAAVEVFPVSGKKVEAAAHAAGLAPAAIPALLVSGDNRAGLGASFAQALADAGINMDFLLALVQGRRFSSVFGFETDADAARAIPVLKKAAGRKK